MTADKLLEMIGDIDDSFIQESAHGRSRTAKAPWGLLTAAACLCLVIASVVLLHNAGLLPGYQSPAGTSYVTRVQKTTAGSDEVETLELTYDENGNLLTHQDQYYRTEYTYDENGNRLTRKQCYNDGKLREESTYTYSVEGLLLSEECSSSGHYTAPHGMPPGTIRIEYSYDENGNLIRVKTYSDDELYFDRLYDPMGNLLEEYTYHGLEYDVLHTVNTYDSSGTLLRTDFFYLEGDERTESSITYVYDENGNLLEWNAIDYQGDPITSVYTYDSAGNKLSETSTNAFETSGEYWTYDENGRILTYQFVGGSNIQEYSWSYDAQGNVISYTVGSGPNKTVYEYTYTWTSLELSEKALDEQNSFIQAFTNVYIEQ